MITDRFPGLLDLPVDERLRLAEELYESVFHFGPALTDEEIEVKLKESLADYRAHPENVCTWEELKARLLASGRG